MASTPSVMLNGKVESWEDYVSELSEAARKERQDTARKEQERSSASAERWEVTR